MDSNHQTSAEADTLTIASQLSKDVCPVKLFGWTLVW